MATNFPTTLDTSTTLPAESASTPLSTNHVIAHQNIQDALEAVEAKIGVDSSAVTTSHDYKLGEVTSTDKAVGKTATQTLTNKTLTAPIITSPTINLTSDAEGDTYYRNSSGAFVRLPRGTDNFIYKMNGNVPNWEAEAIISNATNSSVGIVELATASEITAGTASGSAGPLAITPDQLALSTPVFDGSALTNVGLFTISTDILNTYSTRQIEMIPVSSTNLGGWTNTSTTNTGTTPGYVLLTPTSSSNLELSVALWGSGSTSQYSPAQSKIIRLKTRIRFPDTSDRKGWGLCVTPANIHTAQTDTTNGEVRFILNGTTLYAQNANGTATSTDVTSGITVTNWNTYEIIFTPGVDIKYYINGTLVATHTTNLPTTGTLLLTYGVNANGRTIETVAPIVSIQS